MDGQPSIGMAHARRDFDHIDDHADHLLIVDTSQHQSEIVGTYRLLRREAAARAGGFYSISEFDISALTTQPDEVLELGRSCIAKPYRSGRAIQLLWQAIAAYIFHYEIDILFGCASLPGTDPNKHRLPLAYLHHFHRAPLCLRPSALPGRHIPMDQIAKEQINPREGMRAVPPLIRGYLRLGGFVGDGAVIDEEFRTTDVCVVVKTNQIARRYDRHYKKRLGRYDIHQPVRDPT